MWGSWMNFHWGRLWSFGLEATPSGCKCFVAALSRWFFVLFCLSIYGCLVRLDHSAESSRVRVYYIGGSVRKLRRHGQSSFTRLAATRQICCLQEVVQRDGADLQMWRLRRLPLLVMTVLIDAEIALARPGNFVLFDICEHENGTHAQNIKFSLDGVLKQWIQFKITVLPVVQQVPPFGLAVLTDAFTENLLLIAGSSVRFELYYGENVKRRAYNVKMLVMTFRSACWSLLGFLMEECTTPWRHSRLRRWS